MPGVVRSGTDKHVGHESPTPNPFHQTAYTGGSTNVKTNHANTIWKGDSTSCGDPAVGASTNVKVNGIGVHRKGDATGGHASFVPNSAASGSSNVFVNGS